MTNLATGWATSNSIQNATPKFLNQLAKKVWKGSSDMRPVPTHVPMIVSSTDSTVTFIRVLSSILALNQSVSPVNRGIMEPVSGPATSLTSRTTMTHISGMIFSVSR